MALREAGAPVPDPRQGAGIRGRVMRPGARWPAIRGDRGAAATTTRPSGHPGHARNGPAILGSDSVAGFDDMP